MGSGSGLLGVQCGGEEMEGKIERREWKGK